MSAGAVRASRFWWSDEVLAEDLARCIPAARTAIEPMIDMLRDKGTPREWLLRCEEEGRDGTRLNGCVKLYLPRPAVQWGAVLAGDKAAAKPALVLVARGERHPARPWKPSVYELTSSVSN